MVPNLEFLDLPHLACPENADGPRAMDWPLEVPNVGSAFFEGPDGVDGMASGLREPVVGEGWFIPFLYDMMTFQYRGCQFREIQYLYQIYTIPIPYLYHIYTIPIPYL